MRILITGKNSYIGGSFINFLKTIPDHQVDEISVRDDNWKTIPFKNYEVIIHLAALVHKNERKFTLKEYEKVNVELTINIAKKAIAENVSKFIFFSTMAVFGKAKAINKDTSLNPITKYGITKLKTEEKLKALVKKSDMSLTIIRPPMVYGIGAKGNPNLIERLSKFISVFPEAYNRKSFLSIENLNRLLLEELKDEHNKTIHPQDPYYQSTFQLFKFYRTILKKQSYPLKILGFFLKKLTFLGFINKIFGDLYYDFRD
jgi:UDP-glucose 4-epimerase